MQTIQVGEMTIPGIKDSRVVVMLPNDGAGKLKMLAIPLEQFHGVINLAVEGMHVNQDLILPGEEYELTLKVLNEIIDVLPEIANS